MNPHLAAVLAARGTVEAFPDQDGPIVLQLVGHHAIMTMSVPEVDIAMALAEIVAPIACAEGVILVADSYHEMYRGEDIPDELPPHGDLERRFKAGDPDITECLLIHSAWRDPERFELTVCPYRRNGDGIEWLDTSTDTDDAQEIAGRIPDFLRHVLDQGMVFGDEPEMNTEDAEGTRMGTATFLLDRLGTPCDLTAREDRDLDLRGL